MHQVYFKDDREVFFFISELMSSQQLRIPDVLGKLWGPLLNILHRTKLTSALVQLMVTMVTDKQNFQNFLLCSWLQKIIHSNASSVDFEERKDGCFFTVLLIQYNYKDRNILEVSIIVDDKFFWLTLLE